MRLASTATLVVLLAGSVSAQTPVLVAAASPARVTAPAPPARAPHARVPRAGTLAARVRVGITAAWPLGAADYADYGAQEIEAGTVASDLYVRWYPFDAHARLFAVEVAVAGRPFETVALVAASAATAEYGVHLAGLAPGLVAVRMRETSASGTEVVSASVHVRI